MPASPRHRPGRLLGALALVGALLVGGCDVRVDGDPPEIPSAEPGEILRQQAAEEAAWLQALAEAAATGSDGSDGTGAGSGTSGDLAGDLAHIAADAGTHLADLGGVWTPPPRPTDDPTDPTSSGEPTPSADTTPSGDVTDVLAALESSTAAEQAADDAADADLGTLLASIAINRALWAAVLRADLGEAVDEPGATAVPAALPASAAGVCRTLDALGYTQEVIAARTDDDDARTQAAADAVELRDLAEDVAVAAGLDGTDADPRAATYTVDTTDLGATRTSLTAELLPGWLSQVPDVDGADRAPLIALATQAAFLAQDADQPIATYPGLD